MTLKLHHLRPAPGAKTAKTRVGRGEGSKGKTAGRGTKGTKARYQVPARFEGGQLPLHMRLPKMKGFKNPFKVEFQVVNLDKLGELFPEGGAVGVDDLVAKGAVRKGQPVKVLGQGDLSVAVQVSAQAFSGVGQGQDRGRRRFGHRRLIPRRTARAGRARRPPGPRLARSADVRSAVGRLLGFRRPSRRRTRAGCRRSGGVTNRSRSRAVARDQERGCKVLGAYVNAFRTPDLRRKLLFVLLIIVLFRAGSQIPAPGVNVENVHDASRARPAASTT